MIEEKPAIEDETESVEDGAENPESTDAPMLSAIEARLLGALMEKQLSTPDAYPLTVNSLLSASNQKTNREPVSQYQQGEVVRTLRELESRGLVRYEMGARSERYEQRLTHSLELSRKQHALMTVMLLRGPQTISELQTRTQKLYEFSDRDDLVVSLERLTQGENPHVELIGRAAGQREDRYAQLLCGTPVVDRTPDTAEATGSRSSRINSDALDALQMRVDELEEKLQRLYTLTGHSSEAPD